MPYSKYYMVYPLAGLGITRHALEFDAHILYSVVACENGGYVESVHLI